MVYSIRYTNLEVIQLGFFGNAVRWTIYLMAIIWWILNFLVWANYLVDSYLDLHMGSLNERLPSAYW